MTGEQHAQESAQDPDTTERKPLLSRESVVPLGIAAAVTVFASVSAWQVSGALATNTVENRARFESIEQKLVFIEQRLREVSDSRWKRSDMQVWAELLAAQNPGITVPVIR